MSADSSIVTPAHFAYIRERTRKDDAFLTQLKQDALAHGMPPIWISAEQASFMRILLELIGARTVVEVGTLAGYTAIALARGLPPDGKVITLEIDREYAQFAREQIARSDVAGHVEVVTGDARDTLRALAPGSADAMFLDADKAGYIEYLEHAHRILRPGGCLLADNAFAFGELLSPTPSDPGTPAIRAFNDYLAADSRFDAVIVPIGDGLWVGRRKQA